MSGVYAPDPPHDWHLEPSYELSPEPLHFPQMKSNSLPGSGSSSLLSSISLIVLCLRFGIPVTQTGDKEWGGFLESDREVWAITHENRTIATGPETMDAIRIAVHQPGVTPFGIGYQSGGRT
jgi:hypothetical protein